MPIIDDNGQSSAFSPPAQPYVSWGGVFGGAVVAAAITFVLISFGSTIGLGITPLAATWRPPSVVLGVLSGCWLLAITLGAMAAGGYVVGRVRATWSVVHTDEVEFRDGLHGLIVWALAVSLGALLSAAVAVAMSAGAAKSSANADDSALAYQIDRLLRPTSNVSLATNTQLRDEAGRLLSVAVGHPIMEASERARLDQLVADATGLSPSAADERANASIASAQARATSARHLAILLAFITAASLTAGAATAWEAARIGGRHRDEAAPPSMAWRTRPAVVASGVR